VGFGEALRRGFGAAKRAPGVVGLAFLAEMGTDLLSLGVTLSIGGLVLGALGRTLGREPMAALLQPDAAAATFAGQLFQRQTLVPLAGIILVAALISVALRLLWYSSAARTFGLSLAGETPPKALAAASHLHRTIPVAVLFLPIYAAVLLYDFVAVGSGWIAYLKALETHSGGFAGALALALASSLALLVSFFVDMLFRLALVRSVTLDQGPIDALVGGARLFGQSAPALLGLSFTFGFLEFFASAIAGTGGAVVIGSGTASVALNLYARALSGVIGSLVLAYLRTAALGTIAAIDAGDRGVLPEPPPPPPPPPPVREKPLETLMVVQSEPVLETQLVAPSGPVPGSESELVQPPPGVAAPVPGSESELVQAAPGAAPPVPGSESESSRPAADAVPPAPEGEKKD
jgi:hypothetical protein